MLQHCDGSYTQRALDFIGEDCVRCFYLYMDLEEYGPDREFTDLWLQLEGENIQAVFYRYYNTMHLFSRQLPALEDAAALLREQAPHTIISNEENIRALQPLLEGEWELEMSEIITAPRLMEGECSLPIRPADEEDIPDIVSLMMTEPIYNTIYTAESLAEQLRGRIRDGFGRLFVIRDETGHLVATNNTSAETKDFAVINGLVTDPAMRGRGLGRAITASTWNLVFREGKKGLAHLGCENENTLRLHHAMGYDFIGRSARLVLKEESACNGAE